MTSEPSDTKSVVISDHLVDEEMLPMRLLAIFGRRMSYTWRAGRIKIHGVQPDEWTTVRFAQPSKVETQ